MADACQVSEVATHKSAAAMTSPSDSAQAAGCGSGTSLSTQVSPSKTTHNIFTAPIGAMPTALSDTEGTAAHSQPPDRAEYAAACDSVHLDSQVDTAQTGQVAPVLSAQAADDMLRSLRPAMPAVAHAADIAPGVSSSCADSAELSAHPSAQASDLGSNNVSGVLSMIAPQTQTVTVNATDCSTEGAAVAVPQTLEAVTGCPCADGSVVSDTAEALDAVYMPSEDALPSSRLAADSAAPQEALPVSAQRKTGRSKP